MPPPGPGYGQLNRPPTGGPNGQPKNGGSGQNFQTQVTPMQGGGSPNPLPQNAAPTGNPAAGGGGGKQGGNSPEAGSNGPTQRPPGWAAQHGNQLKQDFINRTLQMQEAASAKSTPTYQAGLESQFGQNNPFGQRQWYGGNPLETAQAVAQREFDKNLAGIRARYAGAGTGNSARAAIAEGTALGEFGTGLGDVLAQRGEGAFQNDATRGLQAMLGAATNSNQRDQTALALNQQLGGFGTGLTGVGAQEQGIPNLGEILGALTAFQSISGEGRNRSRGSSGFGFKN